MSVKTAVIPAAGKGKRLRPLTNTLPKALVPLNGKPVITYILDALESLGFDEIFVITGYMAEKVEKGLQRYSVRFVRQDEQLGTAHAVGRVSFIEEPFLVINADILVSRDSIKSLIESFKGNLSALIGTREVSDPSRFGVLEVEGERVISILEKPERPPTSLVNTGIYIFSPLIFEYIRRTGLSPRGEYEITDSIRMMIEDGHPVTYKRLDGIWIDIGTVEDLKRAERLLKDEGNIQEV